MSRLEKVKVSLCGAAILFTIWALAFWYRSDKAFAGDKPFTVDWLGTWFFGILGGFLIVLLTGAIIVGVVKWAMWFFRNNPVASSAEGSDKP